MSFIAQDFEKLDIITVLEGRTLEPSDVASKLLLWICLVLTMT
ncbi:transposase [Streptococcus pneumoniae]|nr:transposase [Streptococcus pneumoniae]